MEKWTEKLQSTLGEAPARAMSFSRLLHALRTAGVSVAGREEWILKRITEQPEAFKVIPDRLGPWASWPEGLDMESSDPPAQGRECDPWIMSCSGVAPGYGVSGRAAGRIQESLQAWGRSIDIGSQVAVARWILAAREAESALGPFLRELTSQG